MSIQTRHELLVEPHCTEAGDVVVRVGGSLTVRTASVLRRQLVASVAERPIEIHVDLSKVTELDAAGIVAVTAPMMAAWRAGVTPRVTAPIAPSAREVADMAGVLRLVGALR